MEVARDGRRLLERAHELGVDVVDLDRRQAQALQTGYRSRLADESRELVAASAVAVATEVDPRQDDLAMALRDAAAHLAEHRLRRPAPRRAANERDNAEVARETAAVLDLHEGAHAVEPRVRLHAAERPDVARDERRRLLASA